MDCFEIDFQPWRAAHYEIEPERPEGIIRELSRIGLGVKGFEAEWTEAREMLRQRTESHPDVAQPFIDRALPKLPEEERAAISFALVSKGKCEAVRPKSQALDMAIKLLVERKTTSLETAAVKIARAVGPLSRSANKGSHENLYGWLHLERVLRSVFQGRGALLPQFGGYEVSEQNMSEREKREIELLSQNHLSVNVLLLPDKQGNQKLTLRPQDLMHALVLQAARKRATGTTFHVCEECNGPFLTGGVGGRGKRADARFCSDPCRWAFNNERRRKVAR